MSQFAVRNSDAESISSENSRTALSSTPIEQEPPADRRQRRARESVDERLHPVDEVEVVVQQRRRRLGRRPVVELQRAQTALDPVGRRDRSQRLRRHAILSATAHRILRHRRLCYRDWWRCRRHGNRALGHIRHHRPDGLLSVPARAGPDQMPRTRPSSRGIISHHSHGHSSRAAAGASAARRSAPRIARLVLVPGKHAMQPSALPQRY